MAKNAWLDIINSSILILTGIIPVYFLLKTSPSEITSQAILIFGIIIGVIILILIFSFIYQRYKNMLSDIMNSKKEMNEIRKDLNFKELFNKIDFRLCVIEELININKKKKGNIDPRIIGWIILIILLILFLRQISNT